LPQIKPVASNQNRSLKNKPQPQKTPYNKKGHQPGLLSPLMASELAVQAVTRGRIR
jgi:hypothetical protein